MEAILKRLKRDKRGISNVIVVMLSLVLITIIVGNVVLWSYQMNQLDLERIQETVTVSNVTRITYSPWSTAQNEYSISAGSKLSGSFTDTRVSDGSYETFARALTTSGIYQLDMNGDFALDLSAYPLNSIHGIEIYAKYNVSDDTEKWFLEAYNWTASDFNDAGFNNTSGNQPIPNVWSDYTINITEDWVDYVSSNGTLLLEFRDEGTSANQSNVKIDFLGARAIIDGTRFDLRNSGSFTAHIVAIWIVNSTDHKRYSTNLFINSGEDANYIRADIRLPESNFIAKVTTERGNIFVFP